MAFGHLSHGKSPLEVPIVTGERATIVEFSCNEAVTAGDWVDLDHAAAAGGETRATGVIQGNATSECIGVALETVTAAQVTAGGAIVRVCVAGYCENAKSANGIAAGVAFTAAAAGSVTANLAATITPPLGVALELSAGLTVDCYIFRKY